MHWGALPAEWEALADNALDDVGTPVVELTDAEGTPVARWRSPQPGDGSGPLPDWLGRPPRPFEHLHLPPDAALHGPVVVLDHPVPQNLLDRTLNQAAPAPVLLCLAPLSGEPSEDAVGVVRQAVAAQATHPGSRVVVAPADPTGPLGAERRDRVIEAYAGSAPVHDLTGAARSGSARPRQGLVVFLTGLSGSGKSTLARALHHRLLERGHRVTLLDGDVVRRHLSAGLGFSPTDRDENIRRIGWVAAEIAHHGGIAVCSPIAPSEAVREQVRARVEQRGGRFLLIHVCTPLEECERRDTKGLYARARRGEIADFTGVSAPYEPPAHPDLTLDTTGRPVEELRDVVLDRVGPCWS